VAQQHKRRILWRLRLAASAAAAARENKRQTAENGSSVQQKSGGEIVKKSASLRGARKINAAWRRRKLLAASKQKWRKAAKTATLAAQSRIGMASRKSSNGTAQQAKYGQQIGGGESAAASAAK